MDTMLRTNVAYKHDTRLALEVLDNIRVDEGKLLISGYTDMQLRRAITLASNIVASSVYVEVFGHGN